MTCRYAKRVSNKVQFDLDEEVEIKPCPSKSKEPILINKALKGSTKRTKPVQPKSK